MRNLFVLTIVFSLFVLASCSKEETSLVPTVADTEISSNKLPPHFPSCTCADIAFGTGSPYCPVTGYTNHCSQYRNPILLPWGATAAQVQEAFWTQKFNLLNCLEQATNPLTSCVPKVFIAEFSNQCDSDNGGLDFFGGRDFGYEDGGSIHFGQDLENYQGEEVLSYLHCIFSNPNIGVQEMCNFLVTNCNDGSLMYFSDYDFITFETSGTGSAFKVSIKLYACDYDC